MKPRLLGGRGRRRAGDDRRRRAGVAPAARPAERAQRRAHGGAGRLAARQRPGLVAGAAGEPARSRHGADRVRLLRLPADRGHAGVAVHDRHRGPVPVADRVPLPAALVPVGTTDRPAGPLADGGGRGPAVPADPGDAGRQQGGPAVPRLPRQPPADRQQQPRGPEPAQSPAPAGLGAAPRDRDRAHPPLGEGQRAPPARGGAGAGGGVRDVRGPGGDGHARPVRRLR